jgi:hypothetical protein
MLRRKILSQAAFWEFSAVDLNLSLSSGYVLYIMLMPLKLPPWESYI